MQLRWQREHVQVILVAYQCRHRTWAYHEPIRRQKLCQSYDKKSDPDPRVDYLAIGLRIDHRWLNHNQP